jgi:hypothetical protein
MSHSATRRRFQFNLRVMLLTVFLISIPLLLVAHYRNWIRERDRLRAWSRTQRVEYRYPDGEPTQPSMMLRLFGEPGLPGMNIRLQRNEDDSMVNQFKAAFPECEVTVERGDWR